MPLKINIQDAQTRFSQLVAEVSKGEEIIIDKAGKPVARLIPIGKRGHKRIPGSAKGKIIIGADFDHPLPDSILDEPAAGRLL